MKKIFLTLSLGLSTLGCAMAQDLDDVADYTLSTVLNDTLRESLPTGGEDLVKVDTIDYLSDQVQNIFIGASIGASLSMGENTRYGNFLDMSRPSFEFTIGKFFYPQFGLRLTLSYLNQMGRENFEVADYLETHGGAYDGNYKFSMACGFLDGLINFHNVFWKYREDRKFNLIAYFGLGYFRTFGFDQDKLDYLRNPYRIEADGSKHFFNDEGVVWSYDVNGKSRNYFAGHVGLIASYQITEAWDINADLSFNGTDDAYNGVRYRRVYDSYVNIMAGITYHIKDTSGKRRLKYSHYTDQDMATILNRQIYETQDSLEQAMKPIDKMEEAVAYNEMLQTTVSFYIDKTFITEAQERNVRSVARFMESHPNLDVVVTGYADKQTAYPKYNMMLSKKRAQNVYDLLVKKYNVDPNRLSMDYKGDEEQPFEIVNEWNRSVVFLLKPHTDDFKAEVQDKANKTKLNEHESGNLRKTDAK